MTIDNTVCSICNMETSSFDFYLEYVVCDDCFNSKRSMN